MRGSPLPAGQRDVMMPSPAPLLLRFSMHGAPALTTVRPWTPAMSGSSSTAVPPQSGSRPLYSGAGYGPGTYAPLTSSGVPGLVANRNGAPKHPSRNEAPLLETAFMTFLSIVTTTRFSRSGDEKSRAKASLGASSSV